MTKRICKKYKNGKWIDYEFKDLKKNDIFKLFEYTGEPVIGQIQGNTVFYATSDTYFKNDEYMIDVEEEQCCEKCEFKDKGRFFKCNNPISFEDRVISENGCNAYK